MSSENRMWLFSGTAIARTVFTVCDQINSMWKNKDQSAEFLLSHYREVYISENNRKLLCKPVLTSRCNETRKVSDTSLDSSTKYLSNYFASW